MAAHEGEQAAPDKGCRSPLFAKRRACVARGPSGARVTDDHDLPTPPVGPDVDLKGFSSFMLDVDRLMHSTFYALATPDEGWAGIKLWCRAWKQVPPGSLPNDERTLAAFSGAGAKWPKVRDMAMRGFVLCSDNRYYHTVVVEQVHISWKKRIEYRRDQARLKLWRAEQKRLKGNGFETHFNGVSNCDGNGYETGEETDFERR